MHDAKRVTSLNNTHNDLDQMSGLALTVVAPLNDTIEELTPSAELHDQVDEDGVLVGGFDLDDMGVFGEVMHDLNLSQNVVVVFFAHQFPLWNGFACAVSA